MSSANDTAVSLMKMLTEQQFWGVLTLKFQHGEIVHITKEESIQTTKQVPNYRESHEQHDKRN